MYEIQCSELSTNLEEKMQIKFLEFGNDLNILNSYKINDYRIAREVMLKKYVYSVEGISTKKSLNILHND